MSPTATSRTGTDSPISHDRPGARVTAMTMPPTAMTGAVTSIVALIITSIWTCWTSLVLRVMSEPAPKAEISRSEKPLTRSKTSPRRSRPMLIAARAARYVAATEHTPWARLTPSMNAPIRQIYPESPVATPLSMMSALRVGRYREAITCAN